MYSHLSFVVVFFGVASLTGPVHGSWNDDTLSAEDYYVNRLFLRRGNSDFTVDQLDVQNQVLKSHNDYRAKHCAQALALDDKLSLSAQKYADYLAKENKFDHSEGADYGENLYMKSSSKDIKNFNGKIATDAWYNEIKFYDFENPTFSAETGHFTQAIWKETTKMGVGYAKGRNGAKHTLYVVAQYTPPGNVDEAFQDNVLRATC